MYMYFNSLRRKMFSDTMYCFSATSPVGMVLVHPRKSARTVSSQGKGYWTPKSHCYGLVTDLGLKIVYFFLYCWEIAGK